MQLDKLRLPFIRLQHSSSHNSVFNLNVDQKILEDSKQRQSKLLQFRNRKMLNAWKNNNSSYRVMVCAAIEQCARVLIKDHLSVVKSRITNRQVTDRRTRICLSCQGRWLLINQLFLHSHLPNLSKFSLWQLVKWRAKVVQQALMVLMLHLPPLWLRLMLKAVRIALKDRWIQA